MLLHEVAESEAVRSPLVCRRDAAIVLSIVDWMAWVGVDSMRKKLTLR